MTIYFFLLLQFLTDKKEISDYKANVKLRKNLCVPTLSRGSCSSSYISEKDYAPILQANFSSFLSTSDIEMSNNMAESNSTTIEPEPIILERMERTEMKNNADTIEKQYSAVNEVQEGTGSAMETGIGRRSRSETRTETGTEIGTVTGTGTGRKRRSGTRTEIGTGTGPGIGFQSDLSHTLSSAHIHYGNNDNNNNDKDNDYDNDNCHNDDGGREIERTSDTISITPTINPIIQSKNKRINTANQIQKSASSSNRISNSSNSARNNEIMRDSQNYGSQISKNFSLKSTEEFLSSVTSNSNSNSNSNSSYHNIRINLCNICNKNINSRNTNNFHNNDFVDDNEPIIKCTSCHSIFHKKCCSKGMRGKILNAIDFLCDVCTTMNLIYNESIENGNDYENENKNDNEDTNENRNGNGNGNNRNERENDQLSIQWRETEDVGNEILAVQSDSHHIRKKKRENVLHHKTISGSDSQSQEKKNSNKKRIRPENQESIKSLKVSKKSKTNNENMLKIVMNDNNNNNNNNNVSNYDNYNNDDDNNNNVSNYNNDVNDNTNDNSNNKEDDLIHPDILAALQACESSEFT